MNLRKSHADRSSWMKTLVGRSPKFASDTLSYFLSFNRGKGGSGSRASPQSRSNLRQLWRHHPAIPRTHPPTSNVCSYFFLLLAMLVLTFLFCDFQWAWPAAHRDPNCPIWIGFCGKVQKGKRLVYFFFFPFFRISETDLSICSGDESKILTAWDVRHSLTMTGTSSNSNSNAKSTPASSLPHHPSLLSTSTTGGLRPSISSLEHQIRSKKRKVLWVQNLVLCQFCPRFLSV